MTNEENEQMTNEEMTNEQMTNEEMTKGEVHLRKSLLARIVSL